MCLQTDGVRRTWIRVLLIVVLVVLGGISPAHAVTAKEAETLFEKYVELEHAFDPAVAELYSTSALIRSVRIYPDGRERPMEIPATMYKSLIIQSMPLAKTRGDISRYSQVKYSIDGESVRISATRYSELKKYESPFLLVIGRTEAEGIVILEEHTVTRP